MQARAYIMKKNYAAPDEALYHVGFSASSLEGARIAVLPGDPGRSEPVAKAIGGDARFIASHREYTSFLTQAAGRKVLVCSTGMGGPSVAICLEELARAGITHVIRFGTTGTIQERVSLGDVIISKAAARLDGTSAHYAPECFPAVASFAVTAALKAAAERCGAPCHVGISVSSDTFWPGQERYDSFTGYVPRRFRGSMEEWQALGALNYEMETATLFTVAQSLGLKAGAVLGVVVKRTESEQVAPSYVYDKAFGHMADIVRLAVGQL